jgi:serine/alanine adding enzyme
VTLRIESFAGTGAEWDDFVVRQPGATAFHRHALGGTIAGVFGHDSLRLCARTPEGAVVGVLPLVRVKSRLFGHFLVSMPFVSYGGPLGGRDAVRALAEHADRMATEDRVDLLELRSAHPLPVELPVSHRKITAVLALPPGDPDKAFTNLKSKLRSQVRRPVKEGVEVRMGPDQVKPFFRVFAQHMRDLGTPTLPLRWFQTLARTFGDDAWFACAWLKGEPIACGAGFRWGDEFEITWASSLRAHNGISPNMAVYWALIERAARDGLGRFNFGRCTPGSPTHKFKSQWGAADEPLYWYQGTGATGRSTPSPSSAKFALATRVWSRMPLAVANALGPRIVRYIP